MRGGGVQGDQAMPSIWQQEWLSLTRHVGYWRRSRSGHSIRCHWRNVNIWGRARCNLSLRGCANLRLSWHRGAEDKLTWLWRARLRLTLRGACTLHGCTSNWKKNNKTNHNLCSLSQSVSNWNSRYLVFKSWMRTHLFFLVLPWLKKLLFHISLSSKSTTEYWLVKKNSYHKLGQVCHPGMSVSLEQYLPLLVMTPEQKEKKYCVKKSSLVLKG